MVRDPFHRTLVLTISMILSLSRMISSREIKSFLREKMLSKLISDNRLVQSWSIVDCCNGVGPPMYRCMLQRKKNLFKLPNVVDLGQACILNSPMQMHGFLISNALNASSSMLRSIEFEELQDL